MTPRPTTRPTQGRPAASNDPFMVVGNEDTNSSPAKASATAKPARAADFAPVGDNLYLRHIEGQEVLIHNITPSTDAYGDCVDILVVVEGEEDPILVHVSGFLARRLIGLRERVEARECSYPLAARFDKAQMAGGKSVWSMS